MRLGSPFRSLQLFVKYFFAQDLLNYARMIPVYLAEVKIVKDTDPEIYQKLQNGDWVVNKNAKVAFCAVGADNAPEHANRSMKVSGGLIGITLNTPARTKYFLIPTWVSKVGRTSEADGKYFFQDVDYLSQPHHCCQVT